MEVLETKVLIVGAGPTGLMAANQLKRFGIDFILVDGKSGPTIESRAIAVTARSLELYQQMGLSDHVVQNGKKIEFFSIYSEGKERATVKIGEIGKNMSEFSYMLAFEQSKNETLLANNLEKDGVKIYWEHEFIELKEYETGIQAIVKHHDEEISISADYLIACDGARSPVRHQLNFSFKGGTYEDRFFVADTILDWPYDYNRLIITPGKKNFCAFFPISGSNNYRVVGTIPAELDKEEPEFEDLISVIKETSQLPIEFKGINWFAMYRVHHRGVDHFRQGNVFLAGDSAHIHSPAGGQGMNTGLQDAYNLCWKLAMVIKGQGKDSLLETYNKERLPFAKWLLRFTDRGFNMMSSHKWYIRFVRKYFGFPFIKLALHRNWVRKRTFKTVSQTGWTYKESNLSKNLSRQKLSFNAGDRLPFLPDHNIYSRFTGLSKEY